MGVEEVGCSQRVVAFEACVSAVAIEIRNVPRAVLHDPTSPRLRISEVCLAANVKYPENSKWSSFASCC